MKIGLNPAISGANSVGLNKGVKKSNQPAFQAVNQKYLKAAEDWYRRRGNINTSWYEHLRDDVNLFKEISAQDGVDTMLAVRKYVNEGSMDFYNHVLECIKRG